MKLTGEHEDIYPVGLLSDLKNLWGGLRYADTTSQYYVPPLWAFRRRFVSATFERARRGEWRSIKNYFNGYLAEDTRVPRCGTGWTRARALASLNRLRRRHGVTQ